MSKNIYNPLNLDNPVPVDFHDMSDHEIIDHCRGEMNGFYGKKHTGAALENARTAFKGRKHTEETKKKMSKADRAYMKTEEYRKKVSEGLKEMYKTKTVWNKGLRGNKQSNT